MKLPYVPLALALPQLSVAFSTFDLRISLDRFSTGRTSPQCTHSDSSTYGYTGPGVYRIANRLNSKAVGEDKSGIDATFVSCHDQADTDKQKWVIANVDEGEKLIINNGTGKLLSAAPFPGENVRSAYGPAFSTFSRWKLNFDTYADVDKSPVSIDNVGILGMPVGLLNNDGPALSVAPPQNPKAPGGNLGQAWDLEYLGSV